MNELPAMIARAFTTSTRTAKSATWGIVDELVGFRAWGASEIFYFPAGVGDEWQIGSSSRCELHLQDPDKSISRHHATMRRVDGQWQIHDSRSKNGLRVDGVRRNGAPVDPGSVLVLGNFKVVAVSCRWLALHDLLLRVMGWSSQANAEIDEAMQDLRIAMTRRDPLVVRGSGNLGWVAKQLSSVLVNPAAPFAVYDTRRSPDTDGDARRMPNAESLQEAIDSAPGGTVCIRGRRLPPDFITKVVEQRTSDRALPLFIICDDGTTNLEGVRIAPPIQVRPCDERSPQEMESLIAAARAHAGRAFKVNTALTEDEYRWVVSNSQTLPEIEMCVRRLLAMRSAGSILGAGQLLGIAAVTLRRWFKNHPPPNSKWENLQ